MPRSLIPVLALSLLQGCWRDLEPSVSAGIPFGNPNAQTQSGVVLTFEPSPALPCPDGKPARFYVLYNASKTAVTEAVDPGGLPSDSTDTGESQDTGDSKDTGASTPPPVPDTGTSDTATQPDTGDSGDTGSSEPEGTDDTPSPVALILHSSAFDYALEPTPEAPLGGEHFRPGIGGETRMSRDWGIQKVWETLGLGDSIEPTEQNLGTLPAAMVDEGMVGILPINCWGDLWHNDPEAAPNDLVGDLGVSRNGHTMAWWMIRILNDLEFAVSHDAQINLAIDPSELYLIGLGDGARGVVDLLLREDMPDVRGVLFDAPVADLSHWSGDGFAGERTGLQRIYNFADDDPDRAEPNWWSHSVRSLVSTGALTNVHTAVLYSDADPRIPYPDTHYNPLISSLSSQPTSWIENVGTSAHVFSNSDAELAEATIKFLKTGEVPAEPEETEETEEETDTGSTGDGGDTDSGR